MRLPRFKRDRLARIVLTNGTVITTDKPVRITLAGPDGGGGSGHRRASL